MDRTEKDLIRPIQGRRDPARGKNAKISLLTGGDDPSYAIPLLSALASRGLRIDFIGNDAMQYAEALKAGNVRFLNLRGGQDENVPVGRKIERILKYYSKLIKYALQTDSRIFHILWLNKFIYFDRTLLNLYFLLTGKRLVFTAHNINAARRDGVDNAMNRFTLRFLYRIVDHIFVHTEEMRVQLKNEFMIEDSKITVIPFGMNNYVPNSNLTREEARKKQRLSNDDKVALFFGRIAPYKGLENLLMALKRMGADKKNMKLIIAGKIERGNEKYWGNMLKIMEDYGLERSVIKKIGFIPDEEVEVFFKAADVLILPYRRIFQSGLIVLAFHFGLPVIAADVGSLREDIIEGKTGYICRPEDPEDLAAKIEIFFQSDLYRNLENRRGWIREYGEEKHSWDIVGEKTAAVYGALG